jgi:hypothetical protein
MYDIPLTKFVRSAKLASIEVQATLGFYFLTENIGRWVFVLFLQEIHDITSGRYLMVFVLLSLSSVLSLMMGDWGPNKIGWPTLRRVLLGGMAASSVYTISIGKSYAMNT